MDIESYKEILKSDVDKGKRLELLLANSDFQEFISEGFLKDFALDNLQKSMDTMYTLDQRADYLFNSKGTCILSHYINEILNKAKFAKNQLKEIDEEING